MTSTYRRTEWALVPTIVALFIVSCVAGADQSLESKLNDKIVAMECPGALVGIFKADGTIDRYALGVADVKTRAPMQLGMHMRIASLTKPMLGTVVLLLAEEGKLSLDDPISKYVDGVPNGEKITLRQLGNNTSGLFNSIENKDFQKAIMADPKKDWPLQVILDYAFVRESYAAPGERFRYSNTNAVLLGMAVKKVTGQKWSEVVKERICKPLSLTNTAEPGPGGELPEPRPSAYRNGYADKVIGYGDTFYDVTDYSASWTGPAGALYSTLDDLGRAIKPIATGQLLKEESRKEFHHWVDTGRPGFRYGFCIAQLNGGIGHRGDVPGFNATAIYFPERDCSVVTLTNLSNNKDRTTMPADELADLVIKQLSLRTEGTSNEN